MFLVRLYPEGNVDQIWCQRGTLKGVRMEYNEKTIGTNKGHFLIWALIFFFLTKLN